MSEQQIDKKASLEQGRLSTNEMEIDLMDILRKIISFRKTLYKAAGVGLIIGIIVAFSVPKQYTVKVTLSPEMGTSKGNTGLAGIAATFLGNGATMGESTDALNISLSSDIVSSTPFLLELLTMNVPSKHDERDPITLESYLDQQHVAWWNYVIALPYIVLDAVRGEEQNLSSDTAYYGVIELTKKDNKKIKYLRKHITALVDKKTAITNISVTLQDAKVAAIVADSVIHKLQENIIQYRTSKAKEDCFYLEKLFKDRQNEYYIVQKKYANYVDTHDNLILQSVRAEQERLQNDMNIAYQVYSQVANQLQVARAKVQEVKPVFAIVEPAVVPLTSSGMGFLMYTLLYVILSMLCAISWELAGKKIVAFFR